MSCHSCGALCYFMVRGQVKVCVVFIVVVVSLVTILAVILVGRSIGGIVGVIVGPVLSLEERAPVYVSYVNPPGIPEIKTVHTVDGVL